MFTGPPIIISTISIEIKDSSMLRSFNGKFPILAASDCTVDGLYSVMASQTVTTYSTNHIALLFETSMPNEELVSVSERGIAKLLQCSHSNLPKTKNTTIFQPKKLAFMEKNNILLILTNYYIIFYFQISTILID